MKRHLATKALILSLALLGGCPAASGARGAADTLRVSEHFTTHLIFPTDIIYADLSNSSVVAAKILEQSRNMMALKAWNPFEAPLSVSALESNGTMHTYIVLYEEHPGSLVYDMRPGAATPATAEGTKGGNAGEGAALHRRGDAPPLSEVVAAPQKLWHISSKQYDLTVSCTNILSYSDITYLVFSLRNGSGMSYDCPDATFVVESRRRGRRSVVTEKPLFHKSRFGTLSCAPGEETLIGYSLEKISLARDQVLRVYFYESGGQRELVLTVDAKDLNRARSEL